MQISALEQFKLADAVAVQPEPTGLRLNANWLGKAFGSRQVLHDIDLSIQAGEFVAIVGRSGCGKSTLLRLVAGLDQPSQGELLFDDRSPTSQTREATRIMFQDSRLLPWRSVFENVALGLPRSAWSLVRQVLSQVGLAEREQDWPAQLSGGQRQRVALARALVHQPHLLLLDEPLGALDALTRIEMQQLIENIWQQHGFTALLVTHDVQEAIALADRVILIEEGRITLDLTIDLPRPRARGSAAFAALEETVLRRVLQQPNPAPENELGDQSLYASFASVAWAV
ncbi:ATP-binding cassette domain-containing protein [Parvibium lacunae]|uniref:ATP-binding cassette domain-containing protein n=2 Tax=Parvibium lacunae TaxID=1888893 RepID=A0A368L402_9BURK|nr:ATP-binding cassette domain-containing protein [Parvibium lacunae]